MPPKRVKRKAVKEDAAQSTETDPEVPVPELDQDPPNNGDTEEVHQEPATKRGKRKAVDKEKMAQKSDDGEKRVTRSSKAVQPNKEAKPEPQKEEKAVTKRKKNKKDTVEVVKEEDEENGDDVVETKPSKRGPKSKAKVEKKTDVADREEDKMENGNDDDIDSNAWKSKDSIYDFKAKNLDGEEISLSDYKGHVCIIVNVASKCGHTKSNYEQFVELFDKYSDEKGLKILAFPCNQFSNQEPGDSNKIAEFVKKRNVKFDVFEKVEVNGENAHDLWKFLQEKLAGPKGKPISWNFTKFIIDREGKPVERHQPTVKPLKLIESLEKLW